MITAIDLLLHLEAKVEAAMAAGGEDLVGRLDEVAHTVREIAEAALVRGDEVTLQEARRLAARLEPFFALPLPARPGQARRQGQAFHTCPRCGQRFRGWAGRLEEVGAPLCPACAGELLAGIRL